MGEVCDVRCPFIKGGVRALRIVKSNPVINDLFCLETVGDFMQIDGLLLQGPPQFFNLDVVQITAPAIQQDFDFAISQSCNRARAFSDLCS